MAKIERSRDRWLERAGHHPLRATARRRPKVLSPAPSAVRHSRVLHRSAPTEVGPTVWPALHPGEAAGAAERPARSLLVRAVPLGRRKHGARAPAPVRRPVARLTRSTAIASFRHSSRMVCLREKKSSGRRMPGSMRRCGSRAPSRSTRTSSARRRRADAGECRPHPPGASRTSRPATPRVLPFSRRTWQRKKSLTERDRHHNESVDSSWRTSEHDRRQVLGENFARDVSRIMAAEDTGALELAASQSAFRAANERTRRRALDYRYERMRVRSCALTLGAEP